MLKFNRIYSFLYWKCYCIYKKMVGLSVESKLVLLRSIGIGYHLFSIVPFNISLPDPCLWMVLLNLTTPIPHT